MLFAYRIRLPIFLPVVLLAPPGTYRRPAPPFCRCSPPVFRIGGESARGSLIIFLHAGRLNSPNNYLIPAEGPVIFL
jgi:hypothetical protein